MTINLMQGDCLELLKTLPDASVDMVLTDPPYHVGMTSNSHKSSAADLQMLKPFFREAFKEMRRVLKPDGLAYCFTDWRTIPFLAPIFDEELKQNNLIVWDKPGRMHHKYGFFHELILLGGKSPRRICKKNIIKATSFAGGAKYTNGEKLHNAQKPIELLTELILDASDEGQTVLDCFMGSGSTGIACLNTGRKFIGMELDNHYFNVAQKRIEAHLANLANPPQAVKL